ncbi:MAG: ATP-binding protein [Planctomycetota bacterium]
MKYVPRAAQARLDRLLKEFPVVLVVGPRQCGKSTLVRADRPRWLHLDLERPADLALLSADLEGFLKAHPKDLALDEAQRLPAIFPALRHQVDRGRGKGRFLLTGSASPALLRTASETLAGRLGLLELTPFRAAELASTPHAAAAWFWGGYPPVHERRGSSSRALWLDAYVSTYLERDLPALGVQLPSTRLRTLWTMLTHVHGNVLNVSDLARSLSVSSHTVAGDLDVLEQTFMIRRLQPFHANIQKRLTKSPKVFLRDTGLLHFLAGLREQRELPAWPRRGASFEGLVIEELIAWSMRHLTRPEAYYWRTQTGAEVDLLLVHGRRIVPVEIKLGAAVEPRSIIGLKHCMADLGLKRGFVVYGGEERRAATRSIELIPWAEIAGGRLDLPL